MSQAQRIQSINAPGWDGVDATVTHLEMPSNSQRDLDILFKRCFDSEAGKKVLEHLETITIDQPAWVPGADPSFGYAREGQNSIVREIQQRMKRANEPK
jgi:hypothetical protein